MTFSKRLFTRSLSLLVLSLASVSAFAVDCNTSGFACTNLDTQIKGSRLPMWGTDSGSANAYAITTIAPLGPSLRTGSRFMFIATHANTTASTLAVDGGSAIAIKKNVSTALVSGDIALNQVIEVTYDGTNFQLVGNGALSFANLSGSLACSQMPAGTGDITWSSGSCATTLGANFKRRGISFTIYNSSGLASGTTSASLDYLTVPFSCTISAYNLAVDTGTITVKFWKVATGTAVPTSGNSISTSGVSISSGTAIHSTTVSDFTTTTVSQNDIIAMDITAVSSATIVNGVLECDQ